MSRSKIIILLGFGSILLLVSLLIIIGVNNLSKSKSRLDQIINSNNLKIQLVTKMHQTARERTLSLQRMLITDGENEFEKSMYKMIYYGGQFLSLWTEFSKLDLSANTEPAGRSVHASCTHSQ
ncbi:hypothetical protein MNBD_GAMMA23-1972 [hydrothermal vent metagenome]|uniref:Uncharacterized protein n=1 Tax=hydrothermal vent metagenome TaxID=652676 RepID=A0A3B0ZLM3_9ZZZZ